MKRTISYFIVSLILNSLFINWIWAKDKTYVPNSLQAHKVSESPDGRIIIQATGSHKKIEEAKIEAEKTAIYWLILERLLFTSGDKNNFKKIQEEFFKTEKKQNPKYAEFIEWRSDIIDRKKVGDIYYITMDFKINEKRLEEYLKEIGVITYTWEEIVEILGEPSFFIIPNVGAEDDLEQIVRLMEQNEDLKITAAKIKNYFADRRINVYLPENAIKSNEVTKLIKDIEAQKNIDRGRMEKDIKRSDIKNLLALTMGADIYFTFDTRFETNPALDTYQANVQFEAYETTTGKLLSSETGTSKERPTSVGKEALIEEAVSDGLRLALNKIIGYWIEYITKGVPYLVTIHIVSEFEEDDIEDLQDSMYNILEEICSSVTPKFMEETQLEFIVLAKPQDYKNAITLRATIRNKFNETNGVAKMGYFGSLVGKWIQLEIKEAN